jgi:hypothetical protein
MRTGTSTNNVALREQDLYSKPMNTNIHYCLFGLFETKTTTSAKSSDLFPNR